MSEPIVLRVGVLDSSLAIARAEQVARRLGPHEIVPLATLDAEPPAGVTVDVRIRDAADPAAGRRIEGSVVPKRAPATDSLVSLTGLALAELPEGARVGVDLPRRRAQLLAARPDLAVVDLAEAVETQLTRLTAEDASARLDAVVVATADLALLGAEADSGSVRVAELPLSDWPTSPGQGAILLEVAAGVPAAVRRRIARLDHAPSRLAVTAELAVRDGAEAAIVPYVVASAMLDDGLLFLTATVVAPDGSTSLTASHAGYPDDSSSAPVELAARTLEELLAAGAAALVADA